ncbi:MAG: hypothetical protein HYV03_05285 [Deltaproteobacteria bacterium]|nr:hypothetical protein [Deltaproteobacteria bacterium]
MPKVQTTTGINIYYEQEGAGKDVICIAGLSADHTTWSPVLPQLAS